MRATLHLRSRIKHEDAVAAFTGALIDQSAMPVLVTGDAAVYKPDGKLLLMLMKRAIDPVVMDGSWLALHAMKNRKTDSRANYSNSKTRLTVTDDGLVSKQARSAKVSSNIIGFYDRTLRHPFCRQTAFTAHDAARWATIVPLAQEVGRVFKRHTPDRYAAQMTAVAKTHPDYVIPGSPFTTMTVNNTVRSAVHVDAGDLPEGFGCMTVHRRGDWTGFYLCFPEFGCGVDVDDGDVLLFDPHELHANTSIIEKVPGDPVNERISCVYYFRTKMVECGTPEQEAKTAADKYGSIVVGEHVDDGDTDEG